MTLAVDKTSARLAAMNGRSRGPWLVLGLVLAWRLALLVCTAQPIPANDAFLFDGAVVNWLLHGGYFNPSLAEAFPISGHQVFAAYPPLYQVALLPWMSIFGTSVLSAIWFHFVLFALASLLTLVILRVAFPGRPQQALAVLCLFGITFGDRPEDLAHVFGLGAMLVTALWQVGRVHALAGQIALALLGALYTSPVVGAFYFGATFLAHAAGWLLGRRRFPFAAFAAVMALFVSITLFVAKGYPLLWRGFLENTAQTPLQTTGFRIPAAVEILKLARTAPVFLLAAACLPFLLARRKCLAIGTDADVAWLSLTAGIGVTGGLLLVVSMALLSANYVVYVLFAQVLLAGGLLAVAGGFPTAARRSFYGALACCLALLSVRAAGMIIWGAACSCDVSLHRARAIIRDELQAYANSGERVVVSSAFLYDAAQSGVRGAVHSDWTRDRRQDGPDADLQGLVRLRPPKLLLTQFDFYRSYANTIEQLRQRPDLAAVRVVDTAAVRAPDSIPALQRVVQHISWAPVIVTISWK
jgi:hypothetical protein